MITSSEKFILATPTKCATTTLEAVANRHQRDSGADGDSFRIMDWDKPRRQHRMALPPVIRDELGELTPGGDQGDSNEWGDLDRWLLVRNPYTRYMSVYTYLSAPANYSQWGAREIQGREWGGHGDIVYDNRKMSFEQFLFWFKRRRDEVGNLKTRGELTDGRAYRSPWVWTDSLTFSLEALRDQPGEGLVEGLIHTESVFDDLEALFWGYDLGDSINLKPLHSNRTTGYGELGADPGSEEFWGGIDCSRRVFSSREFRPKRARWARGCQCAACAIGVAAEAEVLGYLGEQAQLG